MGVLDDGLFILSNITCMRSYCPSFPMPQYNNFRTSPIFYVITPPSHHIPTEKAILFGVSLLLQVVEAELEIWAAEDVIKFHLMVAALPARVLVVQGRVMLNSVGVD